MALGRFLEALNSKEIADFSKKIEKNSEALEEQSKAIKELHSQIKDLRDDFDGMKTGHFALTEGISKSLQAVEDLNSELEDSITDLKVLKGQLQTRIADKIETEFRQLLSRFEKDVDAISKLKNEFTIVSSELTRLRAEIDKLNKLSSEIKQADFELVGFAKKLEASDNEKLRLMRQIDTMERLVSGLRRRQK